MARKSQRKRRRNNRRSRKKKGAGECLDWTKRGYKWKGNVWLTDLVERMYCHIIKPTFGTGQERKLAHNPYYHFKIKKMGGSLSPAKKTEMKAAKHAYKKAKKAKDALKLENPQETEMSDEQKEIIATWEKTRAAYKEFTKLEKKAAGADAGWKILGVGEGGQSLGDDNTHIDDYFSPKNSEGWDDWMETLRPWVLVFNHKLPAGENRTNRDAQIMASTSWKTTEGDDIFDRFVFHRDKIKPGITKLYKDEEHPAYGRRDGIADGTLSDDKLLKRINAKPKEIKKYVDPTTKTKEALCHNVTTLLAKRREISDPRSAKALCDTRMHETDEYQRPKCEESEKLMKDNLLGLRENKKGKMNPYTTCNLSSAKIGDSSVPGVNGEEQQKWNLYPPTEKISGNVDEVIEETVKKILLQLTTPAPAGKKVHGMKPDGKYANQNGKPIEYYFNATKLKKDWLNKRIARKEGDPKRCNDPRFFKIYGGKTKCQDAMNAKFSTYHKFAKSGTAIGEKTYDALLPISLFFEPMQDGEEKRNIKKRWNSLSPDNKAKVIKKLKHIKVGVKSGKSKEKLLHLFEFYDGGLDQQELSEVRGGKKTRRRRRRKNKHTKKKRRRKRTKKSRRRRKKKSRRRR